MNRTHGTEQPYLAAGIFKIRLPFIHYRWEWSEALQGLLMCATCLGAIPIMTEVLGLSFELAWSMVIINGILYSLHALLGDPVVPGWITPSIPLTIAFLNKFIIGVDRIQALIALQILVGLLFLIMGITGAAGKLVRSIPAAIKAGILLGAAIAAVTQEFSISGRFGIYPMSILIGGLIAYYILFSRGFRKLRQKSRWINQIGQYGMLPAIVISLVAGPLFNELPFPTVEIGSFIKLPQLRELFDTVSPLGIGFPEISLFIAALPTAFIAYIIAFGDFVTGESMIKEANQVRTDEIIDFNSNRSNVISGLRNLLLALFAPYVTLAGPLWAAVTAALSQRYQDGRKAMDSIVGGAGTFRFATLIAVTIVPIVSLVQPVLPVALSITLLVQGYVCARLAMNLCVTDTDRGIAGVMGAVLAVKGAAWGFAVGIILYLLLSEFTGARNDRDMKVSIASRQDCEEDE